MLNPIPKNYDREITPGRLWEWIYREDEFFPIFSEYEIKNFNSDQIHRILEYTLGEQLALRLNFHRSDLTDENVNGLMYQYFWQEQETPVDLPVSIFLVLLTSEIETRLTNPNDQIGVVEQILRDLQIPEDFKPRIRAAIALDPDYWKSGKPLRLYPKAA